MTMLLDRPLRSLREMLTHTQAQIDGEFAAIDRLYREIDRRAKRIQNLEERAAILSDQLINNS